MQLCFSKTIKEYLLVILRSVEYIHNCTYIYVHSQK